MTTETRGIMPPRTCKENARSWAQAGVGPGRRFRAPGGPPWPAAGDARALGTGPGPAGRQGFGWDSSDRVQERANRPHGLGALTDRDREARDRGTRDVASGPDPWPRCA